MKKTASLFSIMIIVFSFSGICQAQTGVEDAKLIEVSTDTNGVETVYIGAAYSTTEDAAPVTSDGAWRIKKIVTATNGLVTITHAYKPGQIGDWATRRNVWTNRANTNVSVIIYK